jgi:diguanylate cyclase (GGDEF)-like protein
VSAKEAFTVAIVDDDAAIRRLVQHLMRRAGYETFDMLTAEEALRLLNQRRWDLAILDRRLPDRDGAEVCAELRANPDHDNRYIIMLTGQDEPEQKVEGLDVGADDYVTKPFQAPELLARVRAAKRIVDLQKELVATNRRLEELAVTDGLTGLHNHRYFQDELSKAFEQSVRYQRPLSLALIDIDFFKKVNDSYGHAIGDDVLKAVAESFSHSIRNTDLAARYGGEEFAILMPETALEDALVLAEKIRRLVESAHVATKVGEIKVTVSAGVSSAPSDRVQNGRQLVEDADKALYRAKEGGRNRVEPERRRESRVEEKEAV